jgi:hypothetical protein
MFVSESIAPLFPYQYGHSRRIACDSESSTISATSYMLNSVSYGWWLDHVYCYNDPDIMVFGGLNINENQSRLISGIITGLFLDGDSLTNASSQAEAMNCLTNAAMDSLARVGQTFIPLEGNTGTNACTVFTSQQNGASYIAVYNYSSSASVTNVSLSRAGISNVVSAVDLWNGSVLPITTNTLTLSLNAQQGRLFALLNPPTLQALQLRTNSNGGYTFTFSVTGNSGYMYGIQCSTNLVNWTPIETISNTTGTFDVILGTNSVSNVYYRAALIP